MKLGCVFVRGVAIDVGNNDNVRIFPHCCCVQKRSSQEILVGCALLLTLLQMEFKISPVQYRASPGDGDGKPEENKCFRGLNWIHSTEYTDIQITDLM